MKPPRTNDSEQRAASGDDSVSIVVRPNRSLPVAGMVVLFVSLSALPLTIGVAFAVAGVWMVLPFAILEVGVLALLVRWLYRHIDDCELVVIGSQRVQVTRRSGTKETRHEFQRYWARVRLERGRNKRDPTRLRIGSHGNYIDIGAEINEEDRANLAAELRQALRADPRPKRRE